MILTELLNTGLEYNTITHEDNSGKDYIFDVGNYSYAVGEYNQPKVTGGNTKSVLFTFSRVVSDKKNYSIVTLKSPKKSLSTLFNIIKNAIDENGYKGVALRIKTETEISPSFFKLVLATQFKQWEVLESDAVNELTSEKFYLFHRKNFDPKKLFPKAFMKGKSKVDDESESDDSHIILTGISDLSRRVTRKRERIKSSDITQTNDIENEWVKRNKPKLTPAIKELPTESYNNSNFTDFTEPFKENNNVSKLVSLKHIDFKDSVDIEYIDESNITIEIKTTGVELYGLYKGIKINFDNLMLDNKENKKQLDRILSSYLKDKNSSINEGIDNYIKNTKFYESRGTKGQFIKFTENISEYSSAIGEEVNAFLNGGSGYNNSDGYYSDKVKAMDESFSVYGHSLKEDSIVYRGMKVSYANYLKIIKNKIWKMNGYVSTTFSPYITTIFSAKPFLLNETVNVDELEDDMKINIFMIILGLENANGLILDGYSEFSNENEYVINRGTMLKLIKVDTPINSTNSEYFSVNDLHSTMTFEVISPDQIDESNDIILTYSDFMAESNKSKREKTKALNKSRSLLKAIGSSNIKVDEFSKEDVQRMRNKFEK